MPTILVVDDSAVDRRLAGGLLARDAALSIEYAVNGLEAMERMEQSLPELVLTDLVMPEMDGLELVAAVHGRYPHLPVILMTSQGSEEIAVRALEQGASSYVPKRLLSKVLLPTVQRVLAISSQKRCHARLLGCMVRDQCSFVLANDCSLISALVAYLQDCLAQMGLCDESESMRVGVALEEALVNAMLHGNLEVSSALRGDTDEAYYTLITRRSAESPYQDRRIHVDALLARDEAVFVIRDEGPGFDPKTLPDPHDPVLLELVSGRGVLLMRAFMDEVVYNAAGNAVTLVKRRPAPAAKEGS
jgi:CheY-like chemotaxis protein/anti-sigma regulatory factor (Ser/Thr protein kinase)